MVRARTVALLLCAAAITTPAYADDEPYEPRPDADASLSEAWLAAFSAKNPGAVKVPKAKAPSTKGYAMTSLTVDGERPASDDTPTKDDELTRSSENS